MAGGALVLNKRQIVKEFEDKLDQEKTRFKNEITDKLNSRLNIIYDKIEHEFADIYNYVETEENKIFPLVEQFKIITNKSDELIMNNPN